MNIERLILFLRIISSFSIALLATPLCMRFARRIRLVNHPNPIVPQHRSSIPYLGGGAVAIATYLGFYLDWVVSLVYSSSNFVGFRTNQDVPFLLGGILFLTLGILDDAITLKPLPKLLGQVFCAAATLLITNLVRHEVAFRATDIIAIAWIVSVVNAVNFTDVCDGLVSGLALITLSILGFSGLVSSQLLICMTGALLGFLIFNFPPAKIFLGDAGTHFLGFQLAFSTLPSHSWFRFATFDDYRVHITISFLALGVFLFEACFITWIRIRKGLKWWRGSPDHFSLRMQAAGFSRRKTIIVTWIAAIFLGAGALLIQKSESLTLWSLMIASTILLVRWASHWLMRHEVLS